MDIETEIEIHKSSCGEIRKEEKMKVWGRKKGLVATPKVVTTPSIPYVHADEDVCFQMIHWKGIETKESRQTGRICMYVIPILYLC